MSKLFGFVSKMITGKSDAADGILSLGAAVRGGNSPEVARLLARPEADVNSGDKDGRTLLHNIVPELVNLDDPEKTPVYDCIALVLAKGANINAVDALGTSPLAEAVKLGDVKTVEFLLKNGADVNTRDHDGKMPLHDFFSVSGPILVRHINRQVDLAQIEAQIAAMLLRNGADVNAVDRQGRTPLAMAVSSGHMKAAEFLLKNGADVNARDNDGKTPLHLVSAIVGDRSTPGQVTKISEMLIRSGADVNARDNKQRTPLFFSRLDCMIVLIAGGADINARDEEGKTPIFCVKSEKCLETLIEKGADVQALDLNGKKYCQ